MVDLEDEELGVFYLRVWVSKAWHSQLEHQKTRPHQHLMLNQANLQCQMRVRQG